MKKGVFNQSLGFLEPDILAELLHSSFDFCPNTLMPIRWLTASGLHVQNSNRERHCFIAINSDAWKRWQQAEKN